MRELMNMKKKIGVLLVFLLASLSIAHARPTQTIHEFGTDSLATITAKQKGHTFVLVIWSLDCEYCQSSLATLSREKREHPDLRVVTLSTDSLADKQTAIQIKKKLASLGLTANAWAFGDAPPEQLRYAIDQKWHGEMPRSYWFDSGGASTAMSGEITSDKVEKMLAAERR